MSGADQHRRLRRVMPLAWLGALLLLLIAGPLARAVAQAPPPDDPPARPGPDPQLRPVPQDTAGQAQLQWQVSRPGRPASLLQADRSVYRVVDGEAISYYYGNVYLDRDTVALLRPPKGTKNSRDKERKAA